MGKSKARNKQQIINEGKALLGAITAKEEDIHPLCRKLWATVEELQQLEGCNFVTACAHFSLGRKCSTRYVVKLAEQGKFPAYQAFVASYEAEVVERAKKAASKRAPKRASGKPKSGIMDHLRNAPTSPDAPPNPAYDAARAELEEATNLAHVASFELATKDAEIARLKAENQELREQLALLQGGLELGAQKYQKQNKALRALLN